MQITGPPNRAVFLCHKTGRDKTVKIFKRAAVGLLTAALLCLPVLADTVPASSADYHGVDIYHGTSENGQIDWAQLKSTQDFVYIKADEGENWIDPMYQSNVSAAKSVGLAWGTYHFLRLYSVDSCRQQADNYWARIKGTGYSLIPAVDVESHDGQATASGMRDCIRAFVDEFKAVSGITPVLYTYTSYANDILRGQFTDCPLWLADYRGYAGDVAGWGSWRAWQYSESGQIAAITNDEVDLDYATAGIFVSSAPAGSAGNAAAPAIAHPISDPTVLAHQQTLNRLHIRDFAGNALAEDGIAGDHTDQAIRNLQTVCGISVDGQWGPQTQAAANSILAKPMLRCGSNGIPVRYIQSQIGGGSVDGDFGAQTEAHVCGWQANCGLSVDGIFGPQCWGRMIGG